MIIRFDKSGKILDLTNNCFDSWDPCGELGGMKSSKSVRFLLQLFIESSKYWIPSPQEEWQIRMMCVSKQESAGSEDQRDSVLTSKCSYKFLLVSVTVIRPGRHSSPGEERLNIALRCCCRWKLHFTKSSVKFYCTSCCLLSYRGVSAIQLQGELALCLGGGHLSVSDRRQRKFSKQRKNSVGVSSSSDINGPWSSVGCLLKSDLLNHQDSHPSEKTTAQKKPFFKNVIRHFF